MIILIAGATHTGKTLLAQNLMEKYKIPYLSIDHLKMGLIRSGNTDLTVHDDEELVSHLWNIVKEIIKTAVENEQNLIIEGCYIPFDWQKDFSAEYLRVIKFYCLIMTENYIEKNFDNIITFENVIENRCVKENGISKNDLVFENKRNLQLCKKYKLSYTLIDNSYDIKTDL